MAFRQRIWRMRPRGDQDRLPGATLTLIRHHSHSRGQRFQLKVYLYTTTAAPDYGLLGSTNLSVSWATGDPADEDVRRTARLVDLANTLLDHAKQKEYQGVQTTKPLLDELVAVNNAVARQLAATNRAVLAELVRVVNAHTL
jgi:hypothetical protein